MKSNLATERYELSTAEHREETKAFLDGYEILNVNELTWPVRTYIVEPTDELEPRHEERGKIVSAMWELKRQHREHCKGYGFIIDMQ